MINSIAPRAGPLCLLSAGCFLTGFLPLFGYAHASWLAPLVPIGGLSWLGFAYVALRNRQGRWVAASLVPMILPLAVLALVLEACLRGDCL